MGLFGRIAISVLFATALGVLLRLANCPDLITGMAMYFIASTVNDMLIECARQKKDFLKKVANYNTINDWECRSNDAD